MRSFVMRPLAMLVCASGLLGISSQALASAFQIWEQDGATIGNYHAGYAAGAEDASTAYYNPAGITRFKNQQLVLGGDAVMTSFKFKGTVAVNSLGNIPQQATAQGGTFGFVPFMHYVAPINERLGFGFSVDAPFGLKTNYGRGTPVEYASTLTSVVVIDYSPSLAYQITKQLSAGLGFDVQYMQGEFNSVGSAFAPFPTVLSATSKNKADDTGYGYHLGGMYDITNNTRVGLSYHSMVVHHLTGSSTLNGPLAPGGQLKSNNASANIRLPAWTSLGVYSKVTPGIAVMANVNYTQWNVFKNLVLQNAAGFVPPSPGVPSTSIVATIPENYQNTINISVGADFWITEKLKIRTGLGYDQTPLQEADRNTQLPDNDRYVIGLGGHYQANSMVGFDMGWNHFFFNQARINPPPQVKGASVVTTNGHATGGADVLGGQVVVDFC